MQAHPLEASELARLPVFPLPHVVFFPGTALPLHLFEPRYRKMIEDCMSQGPRALAVTLLDDGWENNYEGSPDIKRIAGAGRIVAHQERDDGTHDIVLVGLARVSLEEVDASEVPYRRAQATRLSESGDVDGTDLAALVACAQSVAAQVKRQQADFELQLIPDAPPGRVADVVCDQLLSDPKLRQKVLETLDVAERVRIVTGAVAELMTRLSDVPPS